MAESAASRSLNSPRSSFRTSWSSRRITAWACSLSRAEIGELYRPIRPKKQQAADAKSSGYPEQLVPGAAGSPFLLSLGGPLTFPHPPPVPISRGRCHHGEVAGSAGSLRSAGSLLKVKFKLPMNVDSNLLDDAADPILNRIFAGMRKV